VLNNQKMGAQSFEKEKRNLEQFKKCLSLNKNIMLNFATFIHGSQFNIISDLADLDLLKFLTGDYRTGDLRRRANKFTPLNLFKEAARLANALDFLHKGLALPDGNISCAHTDLKPDNILIMWPVADAELLARNPKLADEDLPVGRWLISDFGISVVRPHCQERRDRDQEPVPQHLAPLEAAMEGGSMFTAPRDAGPFQPPEVRGQKTKVTKECDLWSFGCILAMILVFALGGPDLVAELGEVRQKDSYNDYFGNDVGVKPEIQKWLRKLEMSPEFRREQYWIKDFRALIENLLQLEPKQRCDAGKTWERLVSICKDIERKSEGHEKRLWPLPQQEVLRKRQLLPQLGVNVPTTPAQNGHPQVVSDTIRALEAAQVASQGLETPSNFVSTPPSIMSSRESALEISSLPSPRPASGFRLTPPPDIPPVAKLEQPKRGAEHATLSRCGKRVALWNKVQAYVYQLDFLDDRNSWKSQHPKTIPKSEVIPYFAEFEPDPHHVWSGVYLAGPFVALAFKPKRGPDYTVTILYSVPYITIGFGLIFMG
jgi:serine/threonine protein kinase